MPTRIVTILSMCLIWPFAVNGLVFYSPLAQATERQGGGLFKTPPVKKKSSSRTRKKSKKRKTAPRVVAHNYDGKYTITLQLVSDNTNSPCRSGTKPFEIRNNSAALKTWALGDTIGGRVKGDRLVLYGMKKGVISNSTRNPWNWSGQVVLPKTRSDIGRGTFQGFGRNGKGCSWSVQINKL